MSTEVGSTARRRAKQHEFQAAWAKRNPDYAAKWNAAHPDYQAAYRAANREAIRTRKRAWRQVHREQLRAENAAYSASHPEERAERRARYKATLRAATVGDRGALRRIYALRKHGRGLKCHLCGAPIPPGTGHVDHIYPLSRGGAHAAWNLALAHAHCNQKKHARLPAEVGLLL